MNADIKAKWLEALRSGKYEQGKGRLRDCDNQYCCLGVLCDVIDPNGWKSYKQAYTFGEYQQFGCLDYPTRKLADIDPKDGDLLAQMNDYGNKTFAEIADYIEEHL